jgi:uncharacterized protein YciI
MLKRAMLVVWGAMFFSMQPAIAQSAPAALPQYDADLAKSLGSDDSGMRSYVLVILKTGPNKAVDAAERKKMFQGHFANMERLAAEKKLAFAGPLDGVDGRRGIFILATPDIELAKSYVATDPVIVNGEMVAEYHKLFGSAALMMVNDVHNKIRKK